MLNIFKKTNIDPLIIKETYNTPSVKFIPADNFFEIKGKSHPENIRMFFEPVIEWLNEYYEKTQKKKIKLELKLNYTYMNTSSYKYHVELLRTLQKFIIAGSKVKVYWYYEEGDYDMKDSGYELFEMSEAKVPYEIISFNS